MLTKFKLSFYYYLLITQLVLFCRMSLFVMSYQVWFNIRVYFNIKISLRLFTTNTQVLPLELINRFLICSFVLNKETSSAKSL